MVVAVAVAATSVAAAADGAEFQQPKATARVVAALVTSTHHAQHQPHNKEAPTVFYKMLRIH
jgi:Ni/Co efflux regulator RcnB